MLVGTATKACLSVGVWGETNVLDCLPVEYQNYLDQVLCLSLVIIVHAILKLH